MEKKKKKRAEKIQSKVFTFYKSNLWRPSTKEREQWGVLEGNTNSRHEKTLQGERTSGVEEVEMLKERNLKWPISNANLCYGYSLE